VNLLKIDEGLYHIANTNVFLFYDGNTGLAMDIVNDYIEELPHDRCLALLMNGVDEFMPFQDVVTTFLAVVAKAKADAYSCLRDKINAARTNATGERGVSCKMTGTVNFN